MNNIDIVVVTAAVIEENGKVLIACRKLSGELGGFWEFPGGKIEKGEGPRECLRRELQEEFGVDAEIGEHIVTNVHQYHKFTIKLISYRVLLLSGKFDLRDHDDVAWVTPDDFKKYTFAPADLPTVRAILKENQKN